MSGKQFCSICFILLLSVSMNTVKADITSDLISHWKLDDGSGTIAKDSAGVNDGTLMGDATWAEGWIGSAVQLDGDDDYVDCGKGEVFNSVCRDVITLAAWVKADPALGPDWGGIIIRGYGYLFGDVDPMVIEFGGLIDDARIYNRALTQQEIVAIMENIEVYPYASSPNPPVGALLTDTWVNLNWRAGDSAVSHNVYLGDDFDAVNNDDTSGETFRGNQTGLFYVAGFPGYAYPDGLVPGTTYYWRIDEVNDADPNSPWKGNIWSFSIAPRTAYHPNPADGAEFVDLNVTLSWTAGYGAKLHTVYLGDDFDEVNEATGGAPQGTTTYNPGTLESAKVYYWRVDEFDGVDTYKGDVWSFTTPGAVGNPQPANGATDIQLNAILNWTPADFAVSHEVYVGEDKETVKSADTGSPAYKGSKSLGDESYDPGLLESGATYFWRVDEVDNKGNTVKGPVWSFMTGDFLVVDDFEGYSDDDAAGEAIWQTWIDGFGIDENGAVVGYVMPPYSEHVVVHSGEQSLPYAYDNSGPANYSEATADIANLTIGQDWTAGGATTLSLWFNGDSANAPETMYVALSSTNGATGTVTHDDAGAAQIDRWTQWSVPLTEFANQGVNLTRVQTISIGFGDKNNPQPGGTGSMYFDDIRLD